MRLAAFVLVAAALLVPALSLDDKELENLKFIADITQRDNLVPVSDINFGKLVLARSRPYHAVVLFTTANRQGECSACDSFGSELSVLAASYEMLVAKEPDTAPVYFIRAYYHENQATFQSYNIRGVPMLAYYAPTTSSSAHSKAALPPMFTEEVQEAEKMAQFVRGYTGVNIDVYRSPVPGLIRLAILVLFITVIVKFFRQQLVAVVEFVLNNKFIWMLVSLGVYFISVSGVLYDIIRGVPWMGADGQGRVIFIAGSGSQFVAEGLFIGLLNIGCAGCVLMLKRTMSDTGGKSSSAVFTLALYAVGFAVFYKVILNLYRSKNRWY